MSDELTVRLQALTPARLSLRSLGGAAATRDLLQFQADHALARDAVRRRLDTQGLAHALAASGAMPIVTPSRVSDLATHLRNPDLGRRLSSDPLPQLPTSPDGVIVVADGLSAGAAERYAPRLIQSLGWPGLVAVVPFGRVAIGDEIGEIVGAAWVLVLLGERPGLSAPESLGAYLTWAPRVGRTDAERECVSNIRDDGTPPEAAAMVLQRMIQSASLRGQTGILPSQPSPPLSID